MTDTVNVPREAMAAEVPLHEQLKRIPVDAIYSFENPSNNAWDLPKVYISIGRLAHEAAAALAAAPKAEPVSGDWYSAESIDALVREIDVALNGANAAPQAKLCDLVKQIKELAQPEAPKVEQEPVAWTEGAELESRSADYERGFFDGKSTHPAPASDELLEGLEAIKRVADTSKDAFHGMTQGERAISSCGVISAHVDRLIAKHKGPQS